MCMLCQLQSIFSDEAFCFQKLQCQTYSKDKRSREVVQKFIYNSEENANVPVKVDVHHHFLNVDAIRLNMYMVDENSAF